MATPRTLFAGVTYTITEWDGSTAKVHVRPCQSVVVSTHPKTGLPQEFWGGNLHMWYSDGTRHMVSYEYFLSLDPRIYCPPGHLVCLN